MMTIQTSCKQSSPAEGHKSLVLNQLNSCSNNNNNNTLKPLIKPQSKQQATSGKQLTGSGSDDTTTRNKSDSSKQQRVSSHQCEQQQLLTTTTTANNNDSKWHVQASEGALRTLNPIREIIEGLKLEVNPNRKLIQLSIGDPTIFGNLKPCAEITDALRRAESSGHFYGYQTAAGLEEARQAVARYQSRRTGLSQLQARDVILTSGCSHALDLCISALAQRGQNILIPKPGFPLYKTLTSIYGIHYKEYELRPDQNWSIDLNDLESLIDQQTAAIVINNPSNPCGSLLQPSHLLELLELAERHRKPIIADEIYDRFVFEASHYEQAGSLIDNDQKQQEQLKLKQELVNDQNNSENQDPDYLARRPPVEAAPSGDSSSSSSTWCYTPFVALSSLSKSVPILTCGGISKNCRIPGLRLGWVIISDPLGAFDQSVRPALAKLTQRLMGPNSLVQGALKDILERVPEQFYTSTMDFIFANALSSYRKLRQVPGLTPHMPQGSMYMMIRFQPESFPTIQGDLEFTSKLMSEQSVLVLPGQCFEYPNYFRICLTVPSEILDEALARLALFCQEHYVGPTTKHC